MFDKVVLCNQGSSILNQVRSRTLSLESGTVKVLLLGGDKIASNWSSIEVASKETGLSVSLTGKPIPSYAIPSFFSCMSELHVVARCKDPYKPPFGQCHGVLVAVNNQAIILAVSDENIVVSDKLFMTFDVEETNNVLTAKADFDGVITQGILEERLKKIGEDFKLGAASKKNVDSSITSTSSDNLPTTSAVTTYINDQGFAKATAIGNGTIVIKKNSNDTGFSFTLNQVQGDTLDLGLGDSASKGVDTQIVTNDTSVNLPTSQAVASFVEGKNYITTSSVGTSNLKIYKGSDTSGTADCTFSANATTDVPFALGLGSAAYLASESTLNSSSSNLPTSSAVASYISGLAYLTSSDIGNSELKIKKHASDTNAISTGFTANAKQDVTVELGFGDAADKTVDTSIKVTGSDTNATAGDNLPTSEAVRAFVEGKGYLTSASVSNETIALAYNNPALGANQTSEFGTFTLNGTANRIVFGSAAHAEVVYLSGSETIDTVQNQDTHLISLGQAKTLVSNATELKTVAPSDAPMTSGTQSGNGIEIPVGAMVWLALNFRGSVGIMDFTTVSSNIDGTPLLSGNGTNAQLVAYMAQIRDNAGDFYALENQKLAAGHRFRTLNAMDVSGMAEPSYGFALCLCIESPE